MEGEERRGEAAKAARLELSDSSFYFPLTGKEKSSLSGWQYQDIRG